ncbi:MAG: SDR family NAD(P)-dependent oxidoreductase [Alphaproteobacteria bacterium]|nr:SDR family NAD(P)-dependent oxidoreductase [Alphaproteobacteria bacterium]MBM3641732.1 SDR family NAD(P)-dependent oxidoreductase [Alphaproteobacteria bacterium]
MKSGIEGKVVAITGASSDWRPLPPSLRLRVRKPKPSPCGTVYSGTKFAVAVISEGLRHEVGGKIRTTVIMPGAVDTELIDAGTTHKGSLEFLAPFAKLAIPADSIARAIAYAIEQPADVDVNQIVIRPTVQEF